jgi:type IV secretion system protein VirB10
MSVLPKENAEQLALRAKPKPVRRLNRKLLMTVGTVVTTAVVLATAWSLKKPVRFLAETSAPTNTEHLRKPDGLEALPKDYTQIRQVPQLGAPIGELGRPVRQVEEAMGIGLAPEEANFKPNPEDNALRAARLKEEEEAKRAQASKVFFQLSERDRKEEKAAAQDAAASKTAEEPTRSGPVPKKETRKAPLLLAGTIIPAALVTGINSDLPGQIVASVAENVFDTVSGQVLLIPQGTRLVGRYDSQVAYGQRRVMLVWSRLIRPDGSSVSLGELAGVDAAGQAGLEDGVDWHWDRIFKGAALSTLIGIGAELAAPDREDSQGRVIVAGRQSVEETVNQVGQQITHKNLDVKPTLTIRPGYPVRVIVNADLDLAPYGGVWP